VGGEKVVGCPYCGNAAVLMDSAAVYHGRSYGLIYACLPCGAWVGVHKGTKIPKGRLADKALRDARMKTHAAFDKLWIEGCFRDCRGGAYRWLQEAMGLSAAECHIGEFDVGQCARAVVLCVAKFSVNSEGK